MLIFASFILLFYLAYHINAEYGKFSTSAEEEHARPVIKEGVWILPKKVRAGSPYTSSLDLMLSSDFKKRPNEVCSYNSCSYLEAEMQAIGLDACGEERLKISETSPLPATIWICRFTQPGINPVNFKINVVRTPDTRDIIFVHKHDVKVSSLLSISSKTVLAFVPPVLVELLQAFIHH